MAYATPQLGSLKRKRRRREDRPAPSARVYLDSNLKSEIGVLSSDLVADLFPHATPAQGDGETEILYAAVTPWTPNPSPSDSSWAVLPFRALTTSEKPLPASTVRLPAAALSTQAFVRIVQLLSPNKTLRQNSTVEVRVSDVLPLPLDTVFVAVDTEALHKLDEVHKKYGGGLSNVLGQSNRKSGNRHTPQPPDDGGLAAEDGAIKRVVTAALNNMRVVHSEDFLPLPVAHPVTHTPAPPAKILACEPVSQGLISSTTNIVVVQISDKRSNTLGNKAVLSPRLDEESGEEIDTANEAFYSATEENSPAKPVVISKSATDLSNTDDLFGSSAEDSNLSDDSDDMISLAKPGLADGPSGISSVLTSATPRPFGSRTQGVMTPGSVYSNMTSTTIRGGQSTRSKVFRVQGLYEHIPEELLHPTPSADEDEEARVYVDATALARLGCFSGDWVRVEAVENYALPQLSAFGPIDDLLPPPWRPVKVYTLPESMSKRPQRYQVNNRHKRRDSISSLVTNSSAVATLFASPILLSNLKDPINISMSPMAFNKKATLKRPLTPRPPSVSSRLPPTASEVTLRKIVTPISTERALNNTLFAKLKQYFEAKQRIVKPGDLIAIPIDESLGRSVYEGEVEQDDSNVSALLSHIGAQSAGGESKSTSNVAWFSVEDVNVPPSEEFDNPDAEVWGDSASIDPTKMTMRQSGDDKRKLPSASSNTWQYYLGIRKIRAKSGLTASTTGMAEPVLPYISNLQRRLRELILVSTSERAVQVQMPPLTILLTSTQRGIGKSHTVRLACADLGVHFFPIDAHDVVTDGGAGVDAQAQGLLEARCERALECGPEFTVICITHLEILNAERAAASLKRVLDSCRVLVATTSDVDKIPDSTRGLFTHELDMSAPDEGEREGILRDVVSASGIPLAFDVDLGSVAVKTAALVAGDLVDVVDRAVIARAERLETLARSKSDSTQSPISIKDVQLSGGAGANSIISADFDVAVDLARKNFADSIGAPKIPNVQWSDVGGLTHVKDAVIETIQLPLSRPELFAKGLKQRSGILFYGPPGTGKTLLAKAIATEFSLNFFSVKGPELLNMYIGESEANVRRVFQRARDARPCVVFFDELDSVAPKRGNQGDSGGVMDRIVSQLLAELDGMSDGEENGGGVFVIGATNRPDLLDQALLRPGRFDKMLYLGISDTHEKQATILQALTRKFTLDPSISLTRVAEMLPFTFTGADLYALCSDAMLKAVTRSAGLVDKRVAQINVERTSRGQNHISVSYYFDHYSSKDDLEVMVAEEDFVRAKEELVPSVSADELSHYERVRDAFEGATKKDQRSATTERPPSAGPPAAGPPPAIKIDQNGSIEKRGKISDMMKKLSRHKAANVNGGDRLNLIPSHTAVTGVSDTDEDYVIRTDRLSLHDAPASRPSSGKAKGKGKGKGRQAPDADGETGEVGSLAERTVQPEDLYD